MIHSRSITALLLAAALPGFAAELSWKTSETSVAVCSGTSIVWRFVYDRAEPKTYFHPLATVDGTELTAYRPPDHVWHRGLWFSWKLINGVNYWEEDRKTGLSAGLTELLEAHVRTNADHSAVIDLRLSYHPPGQPEVLSESRVLSVSAPDARGNYTIDWTGAFTAGAAPVKLDRTLPPSAGGPAWGGYGGISFRLAAATKGWSFLNSAGQGGVAGSHGKSADWVDYQGPAAGVTIFDHPRNLRRPTPWYLNSDMPFLGAAPLFNEALELKPGETLVLRYRILVHASPLTPEEIQRFIPTP